MTLEQLLSKEVSKYIIELNENYPDMTSEEFLDKLGEFDEKLIEEGMDLSILDDTTDDTEETEEVEDVKSVEEPKKVKSDVDKHKKIDVGLHNPKYEKFDGKRWRPLVSDDEKSKINIHKFIDQWYENATKGIEIERKNKETGKIEKVKIYENLEKHTSIEYLWTSDITNMDALFAFTNIPRINLSNWDTSNVKNMEGMFYCSTFNNKSIENWDVHSCVNFRNMFAGAKFSGDISNWKAGTKKEYVYEDGVMKTETVVGEDGKPKTVYVTIDVPVNLPKVGARIADIQSEEDEELLKRLVKLRYEQDYDEDEDDDKDYYYGDDGDEDDDEYIEHDDVEENKHVLNISEFVNEGLYDKIRKGVKKGVDFIKNKFKSTLVKINDFYVASVVPETGKISNSTNILTTINYIQTMKPKGVSVFSSIKSSLLASGVKAKAFIKETSERYGWIKKGSLEWNNYIKFMKILYEMNTSGQLTEERMTLGSKGSGMDGIRDISYEGLLEEIEEVMQDVPDNTQRNTARPLVIFGAPGIGKTTIPKEVIKEYNKQVDKYNETEEGKKSPKGKKAIIVIECGDLELGGFNIPIPKNTTLCETIYANAGVVKRLKDANFKKEDIDNLTREVYRTYEAPKTWLPVYSTKGSDDEIYAAQCDANGRRISQMVKDERRNDGSFREKFEDTTEGGLIIFDEFLRADPELFKVICQLVQTRSLGNGEYRLGGKWGVILCSNRPNDDEEVEKHYDKQSAAMANRFLNGVYNFIPDFYDWLKWARTDGHFDEDTLNFISRETTGNKETYKIGTDINGENPKKEVTVFKNWHTIDVDKFKTGEEPIPTTPRGWAALMEWVSDRISSGSATDIFDINMDRLRDKACAVIGNKIGNEYVDYMEDLKLKRFSKPKTSKFFTNDMNKIDTNSYTCNEAVKDIEQYIKSNYTRDDIIKGGESIGIDFLNMAKNVDKYYKKYINTSSIVTLHNNIVKKIFKIRRIKEDIPIIKNLAPYLEYVGDKDGYNVDFLI